MHTRRSKTASLLGLLDMGGFAAKLASAALGQNLQKPVGAVAGGDTLTSTQTLQRGGAPNPAAGITPGTLPSLGTPDSHNIQQQPQSMPQAPQPATPAQGPTTGTAQAQPAQPQAQAAAPPQAPGAFKPSAVFSVPHPPSVVANHHAHITGQFTPPAPPQAPPQQAQQPKMAGLLLNLMEGRLTKVAQPPFPNALPQGGSMQGGWYIPPSFQPGQQWPSGFRAPGYAGYGTPGLPGFPAGMAGVSPGMPGGYGQSTSPPNPFQALDDKAQQIEQAFVNNKINKTTYGNWQTYLQKQRGLMQKRIDLTAKNRPPVAAAPDFQPPGSEKPTGPQDTYKAMQDQRAQREAEYATRQGHQKEIDGYLDQSGQQARAEHSKRFGTTSIVEAERMGFDPRAIESYKDAHLRRVLGANYNAVSPEEREKLWEADKQKLTLGQLNEEWNGHELSQKTFKAWHEDQYQDPAFKGLENNPAFKELQRKAAAGDAGAKAEMDKIRASHRNNMDPSALMNDPQMQLLQRTDPAKFNALMQHAQTWGQYNQDYQRDSAEWGKAQGAWGGYLAGAGSGGAGKGMPDANTFSNTNGQPFPAHRGPGGTLSDQLVPDPSGGGATSIGGPKYYQYGGNEAGQPTAKPMQAPPGTRMPPPSVSKAPPTGYQQQGIASQPGSLGAQPQPMAPQPGVARPVAPPATMAAKPAPSAPMASKPAPPGLLNMGGPKPGAPSPGPIGSIKPAVKPPTIKPPTASGTSMGGGAKPSVPGGA